MSAHADAVAKAQKKAGSQRAKAIAKAQKPKAKKKKTTEPAEGDA